MNNSKLIQALQSLDRRQLPALWDFIHSPFFNKSEKISQMYVYLRKYAPDYHSSKLSKQSIFKEIYPGENYSEKKVTNLMNQLMLLVEQFIAFDSLNSDRGKQLRYLLDHYIQSGLEKHYKHIVKQYNVRLNEYQGNSGDYYNEQFLLNYKELTFAAKHSQRSFQESLQTVADNFDIYYIVEKLRLSVEMLSRKRIIASDYELKLLKEVKSYILNAPISGVPAIDVYSKIVDLLENEEDENCFLELKALMIKYSDYFSSEEARQVYSYAVNYCIRKFNKGQLNYLDELFELNKLQLEKDLLLIDDSLPPWRFKNIVAVGVKTSNIEWTEAFIKDYADKLDPQVRDIILNYNQALIAFSKQEYDRSMELLLKVDTDDVFLIIDAKSLLIKVYFEKNEREALYNLLESFRIYIQRNKILSEYHKTVRLNFIKYLRKMLKIPNKSNSEFLSLKKEIANLPNIESKDWFYTIIDNKLNA